MRLKKIKLAGFKSFVDPTVLEVRSQLMAVVGPNGCGKSNVIDAVRWVMGESSIKKLRGESPADVIFSGSGARKPVGQATVELVFDNSDGSLGGEYANYAEVSIRRLATRDGDSSYFLNGIRCRRRDITEIFMGTGLGPRSYSIIEQGMISRLIEAKPEDLRAFVEEAAGISLYRKRRQETEIRMRHTRENLERLQDLRQELEKQLDRLKRQSESAIKYNQYKAEHDKLDAELTVLRWKNLESQLQERELHIKTIATALEGKQAERTKLELDLEKIRLSITDKGDVWKQVQNQFYDLGTQVARVEQTLEHHRERQETLRNDLADIHEIIEQSAMEIKADEAQYETLKIQMETLRPEYEAATELAAEYDHVLSDADKAMRDWTEQFERFQENASEPERAAEVQKTKIEQLERQSRESLMRIDRLDKEMNHYQPTEQAEKLAALEEALLLKENEGENFANELQKVSSALSDAREQLLSENSALDEAKKQLQRGEGRLASLSALQEAALGKTNKTIQAWLDKSGLLGFPRLAQGVQVEKGFERAVETVLGNALEAVCVDSLDAIKAMIPNFLQGQITLFESSAQHKNSTVQHSESTMSRVRLIDKLKSDKPLDSLLNTIYIVEDLKDALLIRSELLSHESVVTQDGIWIGLNWLRLNKGDSAQLGVFERESELKELSARIHQLSDTIADLEERTDGLRETIRSFELQRETLHKAEQSHANILRELSSKLSTDRSRLDNIKQRIGHLDQEKSEQKLSMQQNEEEIALARLTLQTALDAMAESRTRKELLLRERDTLRQILQKATADSREAKDKVHTLALQHQKVTSEYQAIDMSLKRLKESQEKSRERAKLLQHQSENLSDPIEETRFTLEDLLTQRLEVEEKLNSARSALDEEQQAQNRLEKQRNHLEQEANHIRTELEQLRMDWQALEVRKQTIQEKLSECQASLKEILESLPSEAEEKAWAEQLDQVAKRIERLGAINLTAIEEYETESERKNYLDSQHNDLTEALATLEDAIRKIDKESRTRFKETYDKVNTEFQALFPRLFGGGQAYLELQGDDLLECGVTVMARPPGKRNSSIHLLSGGEKALTAVSLVFAIFQLNPAPFCLLDEVDAPLDDANVGRFCELVKHMSQTVQFIFITHNKLAMNMAEHLIGVTQKEQGVSRLVAVDVDKACELAVA